MLNTLWQPEAGLVVLEAATEGLTKVLAAAGLVVLLTPPKRYRQAINP